MWDEKKTTRFRKRLLAWYGRHCRALPWRDNPNPYRVWVSEIMLQQTQTRTVLKYYERFLRRFPDVESLAQASESEILQLWAGLGYYIRARNLQRAANRIVEVHRSFPQDFSDVLALPGIGRYTAGAICSIAFNQPYPIVDGNIRRVLTRLGGIRERISERFFWNIMSAWIPAEDPSSFNQAMMELGALICVPSRPKCPECPVRTLCEARRSGIEMAVPTVRARRACSRIRIAILVVEQKRRILVSPMRPGDIIPGDWGFPWRVVPDKESEETIALNLCKTIFGRKVPLEFHARIRHGISNHQITGLVFGGKTELQISKGRGGGGLHWADRSSVRSLLTSSLFRKALEGRGNYCDER
jgi:A/G-specific adenine glycosylase